MAKLVPLFLLLLICPSAPAGDGSLDLEAVRIRQVRLFFGIDEAFLRAGRRLEGGRPGYEFGAAPGVFKQVYGIACLPEGSGQYACFALAHIRAMQAFIFRDQWMRREYFKYFAKYWHNCSPEKNEDYRKQLFTIWLEEREKLRLRGISGGFDPTLSATEY